MLTFFLEHGALAIFIALMTMVIPTEIVLSLGGFLIIKGETSFLSALFAATTGGVLSQLVLYYFAKFGGRRFILKYGKYILLQTTKLEKFENWFKLYGTSVLLFARIIPGPRSMVSIAAGLANISVSIFLLYTTLALLPVSAVLLYIGTLLGKNWSTIQDVLAPYVPILFIAALLCMLLVIKIQKHYKKKRERNVI